MACFACKLGRFMREVGQREDGERQRVRQPPFHAQRPTMHKNATTTRLENLQLH